MKSVDWDAVGRHAGEVDLEALERGASALYAAGHLEEFRAACDAVASLATLRALAERRGDVPWLPMSRAIRDQMAGRDREVGRG